MDTQEKKKVAVLGAGALAMSGATDIPVAKEESPEIKPKPLEISYDKNGKRKVTRVWESEQGSYLTNPRNLVRRKLSGRQRKRMFKQSYRLKKMEKAIEESGKYVKDKAIEC